MNNTAKDIGNLPVFDDANKKLKILVQFFWKSSYAGHHLTDLQIIEGIMKGIIGVGDTRFLTLFYAIEALLPSLPLILELIKTGVLEVKTMSFSNKFRTRIYAHYSDLGLSTLLDA